MSDHKCAVCSEPAFVIASWPLKTSDPRPVCASCYGKEIEPGIWEVQVPVAEWTPDTEWIPPRG